MLLHLFVLPLQYLMSNNYTIQQSRKAKGEASIGKYGDKLYYNTASVCLIFCFLW